ncbi:hypothetical protein B0I73DRAFT_143674 [Yarrowia lipolytica]|nr:hypothetical protein B0I73DRAFT_143674 [Yarrowia lipolytica]
MLLKLSSPKILISTPATQFPPSNLPQALPNLYDVHIRATFAPSPGVEPVFTLFRCPPVITSPDRIPPSSMLIFSAAPTISIGPGRVHETTTLVQLAKDHKAGNVRYLTENTQSPSGSDNHVGALVVDPRSAPLLWLWFDFPILTSGADVSAISLDTLRRRLDLWASTNGYPSVLFSDHAAPFQSADYTDLCHYCIGVESFTTLTYHHNSNDKAEISVLRLKSILGQ